MISLKYTMKLHLPMYKPAVSGIGELEELRLAPLLDESSLPKTPARAGLKLFKLKFRSNLLRRGSTPLGTEAIQALIYSACYTLIWFERLQY